VTFAATRKETIAISPLMAKALALTRCLQQVHPQEFHNLIIETDVEIVKRCFGGQVKHADIDHLIFYCST